MNKGALLAVALLAGRDPSRGASEAIRAPPAGPPAGPRQVAPEQREATSDCIWFWSYRLAPAAGSIGDVAEAAVSACWTMIEHFETLSARNEDRPADPGRAAAPFRREAMYRVAEARAGDCEAP